MKATLIYGYERVYQAEIFPKDFVSMFGKNAGETKRYISWLATMLYIIDAKGTDALRLEQFEYVQNTSDPNLYAIRHPRSKINDRYLFVYENSERTVLLTAFKEKDKRDYRKAIIRANNIYRQLDLEDLRHDTEEE